MRMRASGTALHDGKDLAVSPFDLADAYTKAHPFPDALSLSLKSVSARTSRLAACGRYPLPCCRRLYGAARVRTFLCAETLHSGRPARSHMIIPHNSDSSITRESVDVVLAHVDARGIL